MRIGTSWPWALLPFVACVLAWMSGMAWGQSQRTDWTHPYDLGVFGEYSPTSSHMIMGYARQRELVGVGGSLAWRLVDRHSLALAYLGEVRPLLMESDPILISMTNSQFGTIHLVPPWAVVDPVNPVFFTVFQPNGGSREESFAATYSRRWTYTGGASPVGFKLNGWTHRRLQPEFMGNGGFLISTRDIPVSNSSSFNFTFELGAGLQWYRTASQSILTEVRFHHLSNGDLGTANPGVDSVLWKVTYIFGRRRLLP